MDRVTSIGAALLLCGCAAAAPEPPPTVPPPPPCPVSSSSGWRAWVSTPAPGKAPVVNVSGEVVLPYAGWQPHWGQTRVLESFPAQVQVDLDFAYRQGAAEPPVRQQVGGSWPAEPNVGSVTVMCRGTVLARITTVEAVR